MKKIFAGFLSIALGLVVLGSGGLPAFWTFQHIRNGDAPVWGYAPLAVLCLFTLLVSADLLRKGFRGVGPRTNIR